MPRQPPDDAAIRARASRESFERGRDYWRHGAVSELIKRGNELTAEVQGSDITPYRVAVRFDDAGVVDARCTCPYDWGGFCKHIVATLLKLAHEPGAVEERPPVRDRLNALDRDRLIALIVKRLDRDPDFAGWIEAELVTAQHQDGRMPVDPLPLVAQTRAVLAGRHRPRRYWEDYRSSGDAAELQTLVEKAIPFLEAGDGRNALRILEAITDTFVNDWVEYEAGSDEHLYPLFADLGRMMAEAALMSDLEREERDHWATTLAEWQDQLADFGLDESFEVALRAVEAGWEEPELGAVLTGEAKTWPPPGREHWWEHELTRVRLRVLDACGRTEDYLNLARAAGARASVGTMLVRLGRTAEAMAYARDSFAAPGEALELAKALREAGQHDAALAIAEAGLVQLQRTLFG
jgi:uncharacterized Zn finger protein